MREKTKIYLIRHGKSQGNLEKRFQGRDNTPLSEIGREQARLLKRKLARTKIDIVYHSPLLRAKETAYLAFDGRKVRFVEEPELIERSFGRLDGMSLEEVKAEHPEAEDFYHGKVTEISGYGVETIPEMQERTFRALQRLVKQNQGKSIALVGHLFWTKSLLSRLLGVPYEEIQKTRVGNGSVSVIHAVHEPLSCKYHIRKIGDETHLAHLKMKKIR